MIQAARTVTMIQKKEDQFLSIHWCLYSKQTCQQESGDTRWLEKLWKFLLKSWMTPPWICCFLQQAYHHTWSNLFVSLPHISIILSYRQDLHTCCQTPVNILSASANVEGVGKEASQTLMLFLKGAFILFSSWLELGGCLKVAAIPVREDKLIRRLSWPWGMWIITASHPIFFLT